MALSNSLLQKPKQNYQRDKRNTCADKNYQQDKYNATPVLTVFTAPGFSLSPTHRYCTLLVLKLHLKLSSFKKNKINKSSGNIH